MPISASAAFTSFSKNLRTQALKSWFLACSSSQKTHGFMDVGRHSGGGRGTGARQGLMHVCRVFRDSSNT